MIPVFRKTRNPPAGEAGKMADDNKPLKYLRYAIGEIVLVVIGILIALQINSWNNLRQLKIDNKLFLGKMLADLNQNKARMKELAYQTRYDGKYPSYEQAVNECDSILKLTYKGLNASDFEFIANSQFDAAGPQLNLQKSTYEELLNTGKLYTLGSDSLINSINNYFKLCESEERYNDSNNEVAAEDINLMRRGLGLMIQDYQMDKSNFDINNYPWFFDKASEEYLNIKIGMDNLFLSQKLNLFKMNRIIQETDTLISTIQIALNK